MTPPNMRTALRCWKRFSVRGAVLVASAHHVLATDATNEYAAENLVHEREIFAVSVSRLAPQDLGLSADGGN